MKQIVILLIALAVNSASAGYSAGQIRRGMTEAQVRAIYGEPDKVSRTETGDQWIYERGMTRMLIPIYGAFQPLRVIDIHFNSAGRVRSYSVEELK